MAARPCLRSGEAVARFTAVPSIISAAVLVSGLAGPSAAGAAEAVASSSAAAEVQQAYDRYAGSYDELDGGVAAEALGFPQLRQQLLAQARGRVLEVAVGTGLNLPYYSWDERSGAASGDEAAAAVAESRGVSSVEAVDLSPGMLDQARRRTQASPALSGRSISFRQADVTALPYGDDSFDSVVDTFSLCVFPDPGTALKEMARVVRPSGRVLLLEHTRSDNPLLAAYQDATAGPVAALGKGCVWNQDVEGLAAAAGLRVEAAERSAAGTVELLVATKR
ncbi:hypothetical protein HYH03_018865 [Edaphochlamys debaryana]|uniref:Methyltransferase type 11 domain-containing protein n=1 Tax=Edaphochlamys debaryana TaxID=47281 RepID=A0A836BNX8_9CHLO|nr:hypothetical protein HYH03_018865 [Edaphochlamys debaryana]|eukprot:KAG2482184.1 hypothetical protein HYH03_018865 [Edaphochlamys debaryana]